MVEYFRSTVPRAALQYIHVAHLSRGGQKNVATHFALGSELKVSFELTLR